MIINKQDEGFGPTWGVIPQLDYAKHQNKRLSPHGGVILNICSGFFKTKSFVPARGSYSCKGDRVPLRVEFVSYKESYSREISCSET